MIFSLGVQEITEISFVTYLFRINIRGKLIKTVLTSCYNADYLYLV